jgi:hypothetical protein
MRWLLVCLAACSYSPERSSGGGDDGPDTPDGATGSFCFGQFASVCLATLPTVPFTIGGGDNTVTTDTPCEVTTTESTIMNACVVAGTTITIDGRLTGIGSRPLILLATEGSILIPAGGTVDVSSHRTAAARGAGANPIGGCAGGMAATGSGGGAGGSFGGLGGEGGTGNNAGAGAANPIEVPTTLRGGCPGGAGGTPIGSMDGGDGGGGVLLIATSIMVDGSINASGEGGLGGSGANTIPRGGAGGGSGGMIVFDASMLIVGANAGVMAQGGGGGESSAVAISGNPGGEPDPAFVGQPAAGGFGAASSAQNGGNGGTTGAGDPGFNGVTTNGGGGGGGTGLIRNLAAQSQITGTIVPTPM